jgi:hypothetical protein
MTTSLKSLFSSLVAGDLLKVYVTPPLIEVATMFNVTVLRVDDEGGLHLSQISHDKPVSVPLTTRNPFHWSDDKGALVDRDGDVPRWYSDNITLDHLGARRAAAEYAAVPRAEHTRHTLQEGDMSALMDSFRNDPRYSKIEGIVNNGEAGSPPDQLSLVLDVMGVDHTQEQLVGLSWFLLLLVSLAQRAFQLTPILINLGDNTKSAEDGHPQ